MKLSKKEKSSAEKLFSFLVGFFMKTGIAVKIKYLENYTSFVITFENIEHRKKGEKRSKLNFFKKFLDKG